MEPPPSPSPSPTLTPVTSLWNLHLDNSDDDSSNDNSAAPPTFSGYYDDLKRVMEETLTPRMPPMPDPDLDPSPTEESDDSDDDVFQEQPEPPSLSRSSSFRQRTLPELRALSLKHGDRPLPTPRSARSGPVTPRSRPSSRSPSPRSRTPRSHNYQSNARSPRPNSRNGFAASPRGDVDYDQRQGRRRSETPRRSSQASPRREPSSLSPRTREQQYASRNGSPYSSPRRIHSSRHLHGQDSPGTSPRSSRRSSRQSPRRRNYSYEEEFGTSLGFHLDFPYEDDTDEYGYVYDNELAFDDGDDFTSRRSRRSSYSSDRVSRPRTPRSARQEESQYLSDELLIRPPSYSELARYSSGRNSMSKKYLYGADDYYDGEQQAGEDVAPPYILPNDFPVTLGTQEGSDDGEKGWTRKEKLLIVSLIFAAVIVVVLFLIVFLVMSGLVGDINGTNVHNNIYGQSSTNDEYNSSPLPPQPPPTTAATTRRNSGQPGAATTTTTTASTTNTKSTSRTLKPVTFTTKTTKSSKPTTTTKTTMTPAKSTTTTTTTTTPSTTTTITTTTPTTAKTPSPTTNTTTSSTSPSTQTSPGPTQPTECLSEECRQVSQAVKASLDQGSGALPCDNFYRSACGKNSNPLTAPSTSSDQYSPLLNTVLHDMYRMAAETLSEPLSQTATRGERAAKAIFASCQASNNDYDSDGAFAEMHNLLRGLQFSMNMTSPLSVDVMLKTSLSEYGAGPLFTVKTIALPEGAFYRYTPVISPPSVVLDFTLYDTTFNSPAAIKAGEDYYLMTQRFNLEQWFAVNSSTQLPPQLGGIIDARLRQVLNFEKQLHKLLPGGNTTWLELTTDTMTVSQLQQLAPAIDWPAVLAMDSQAQVGVYHAEYLAALSGLLGRTEEDVVKAYIFYQALFGHLWMLAPAPLRELVDGFLPGVRFSYTDSECAKITFDAAFPDVLSLVTYGKRSLFQAELAYPSFVIADLVSALDNTITGLAWLTDTTRQFLQTRLAYLSILTPEFAYVFETLPSGISINVSNSASLASNALSRQRAGVMRARQMVGAITSNQPEETFLQFSPLYVPAADTLFLPVAFLHLGSWLEGLPDLQAPFKYLLLRSVLRGLFHGETQRSWSDASHTAYAERVTCLVNNVIPVSPDKLDTDHLLNLVAAAAALQFINKDETGDGGRRITLGQETFSDHKEFRFHLLAQLYCSADSFSHLAITGAGRTTPEVELNLVVANDPHFTTAFGCKSGSPMAGVRHCSFWDNSFT